MPVSYVPCAVLCTLKCKNPLPCAGHGTLPQARAGAPINIYTSLHTCVDMPQSATADVNAAVTVYRANMRSAMKYENWQDFISCVRGLNGCLPEGLKLLFGFDTVQEQRYVECPNKAVDKCDTLIDYKDSNIRIDVRAHLFTSIVAGAHQSKYLECPKCKRRVYLDQDDVTVMSQSTDIYNPDTVLPMPPKLEPIPCREIIFEWANMVVAVIEDRCRRWRLQFSTQDTSMVVEGIEQDGSDTGVGAGHGGPAGHTGTGTGTGGGN